MLPEYGDDDGVETGAVEERGNDLERREDGQLDGPCMQRRLVVQADAAVICRRCPAAFARPCALHVLEAGWSARGDGTGRCWNRAGWNSLWRKSGNASENLATIKSKCKR